MYETHPKPLEETDPELSELLKWYCNSAPIKTLKRKEINDKEPTVVEKKVGRNDPCTCGSGKKFKKCCGKK